MSRNSNSNRFATILRWSARISSLISAAILFAFMFGGQEQVELPAGVEVIGFLCFPIGVLIGMGLGWKFEIAGGLVAVISLVGFYIWHFAVSGSIAVGPYFFLFTIPGFLFLLSGLVTALGKDRNTPIHN